MTKNEAFKYAERFLLSSYGDGLPEYCALAIAKCAERDEKWICSRLEEFIEFEREIIKTIKNS